MMPWTLIESASSASLASSNLRRGCSGLGYSSSIPAAKYVRERGALIGETCGRMHKRLSLEMGGKNAMIVMDDADLDLALEGVLWGAFGTTGQRCTATSRLLLHKKVHDRFLRRLADAAEGLRLGDGRADKTDVGPLIHEASRDKVERYVEIGREQGAELVTGGKAPGGRLGSGWFFRPTVFAGVKAGSRLEQEEIFGPVLSVIRFGSFDEAVAIAPQYLPTFWERAQMADRWGERDLAIQNYNTVLKINGVYAHARKALERLGIATPP